jgi:hypothetical protein
VLARLPKRHYTFARRRPERPTRIRVRQAILYLKALIRWTYFFVTKAKRQCRDRIGQRTF